MSEIETQACEYCRFGLFVPTAYFRDAPGVVCRNEKVRCRRYPTEVQKLPTDWCGEYQPAIERGDFGAREG